MSVICDSVSVVVVRVVPSAEVVERVEVVSVNSTYSPTPGSIFFLGRGGCCWRCCCRRRARVCSSAALRQLRETRRSLMNGPIIAAHTIRRMQMTMNVTIGQRRLARVEIAP